MAPKRRRDPNTQGRRGVLARGRAWFKALPPTAKVGLVGPVVGAIITGLCMLCNTVVTAGPEYIDRWNESRVQAQDPGSVYGLVYETVSGAPIPGTLIQAKSAGRLEDERTAQSNGDGRYQVAGLFPMRYYLSATKPRYHPQSLAVKIRPSEMLEQNIELVPTDVTPAHPFEDGSLTFLADISISGTARVLSAGDITVSSTQSQLVSLNVPGFERDLVLLACAVRNNTCCDVLLDLRDSRILAQAVKPWLLAPEELPYDLNLAFDYVATQFVPGHFEGSAIVVPSAEEVSGVIAFSNPEDPKLPDYLYEVSPTFKFERTPYWDWTPDLLYPREVPLYEPQLEPFFEIPFQLPQPLPILAP